MPLLFAGVKYFPQKRQKKIGAKLHSTQTLLKIRNQINIQYLTEAQVKRPCQLYFCGRKKKCSEGKENRRCQLQLLLLSYEDKGVCEGREFSLRAIARRLIIVAISHFTHQQSDCLFANCFVHSM